MNGDGFNINGKNYYYADPTYIGAEAGRCMPQFKNVKPTLFYW